MLNKYPRGRWMDGEREEDSHIKRKSLVKANKNLFFLRPKSPRL